MLPFVDSADRRIPMSGSKRQTDGKIPTGIKAAGLVFLIPMAVVPIGVGLTLLGFLWLGSDGSGSPPLVFKIFGSFIALGFLGFGAIPLIGAVFGGAFASGRQETLRDKCPGDQATAAKNFACPRCSAPVADIAEVSSTGDVLCSFCHGWFNIRAS
jgi:hypothetical protein